MTDRDTVSANSAGSSAKPGASTSTTAGMKPIAARLSRSMNRISAVSASPAKRSAAAAPWRSRSPV